MAVKRGNGEGDDAGGRKAVAVKQIDYEVAKAVTESVSETVEEIMLEEFKKFQADDDFVMAAKDGFMGYVSTLGLLSFALREESAENVAKVMNAVGLEFDPRLFGRIPKIYSRNRLVYVYAFYYLVTNGRSVDVPEVRAVVEALGMDFDRPTFEEALVFICSKTKCGRITL
jgi:ribosomal protein L12E/L44/L45/RPP1/RPP2